MPISKEQIISFQLVDDHDLHHAESFVLLNVGTF